MHFSTMRTLEKKRGKSKYKTIKYSKNQTLCQIYEVKHFF